MVRIYSENNVLKGLDCSREDKEIIVPDNITEIERCELSDFYRDTMQRVYLPDSILRYDKDCFDYSYFPNISLPYRKTLELGVTSHTYAKVLTLRLDDGVELKFNMSKLSVNPVGMMLKLFRTEEMRLKCAVEIKGTIAVYLAIKDNNAEALEYVKKNASKIGKCCIDLDDFDGMERLLALGIVSKVPIDTMIRYAQSTEKNEFYVFLTQYKHGHYEERKTSDRFRL